MTRINVIHPRHLCDEHLRAEYREITRIPNTILKRGISIRPRPKDYVLGEGHVLFFEDKLGWLRARHRLLQHEMVQRGFTATDYWNLPRNDRYKHLYGWYVPTVNAIRINKTHIMWKWPKRAHYYGVFVENEKHMRDVKDIVDDLRAGITE